MLHQPELLGLAPIPILLAVAHEDLEHRAAAAPAAGYIYDIINLASRRPAFGGPVAAPWPNFVDRGQALPPDRWFRRRWRTCLSRRLPASPPRNRDEFVFFFDELIVPQIHSVVDRREFLAGARRG